MTWTTENCVLTEEKIEKANEVMNAVYGTAFPINSYCRRVLAALAPVMQMRGECAPQTELEEDRAAEMMFDLCGSPDLLSPMRKVLSDFCRRRADERDALRKENEHMQAELEKMKKERDKATFANFNDALEDAKKQDDEFTPAQLQKIREAVEEIGIKSSSWGKGLRKTYADQVIEKLTPKKTPEERYVVRPHGERWQVIDTVADLSAGEPDFSFESTAQIFRLGLIAKAKEDAN